LKKYALLLAFSSLIFIYSCGQENEKYTVKGEEKEALEQARKDSLALADSLKKYDIYPRINYKKLKIDNWKHFYTIQKQFGIPTDDKVLNKIFMTLNRKELRFFGRNDSIVIPDTIIKDVKAYSLFPQFWWGARKIPKIIVVTNKYQCYACYEFGKLVRFAACNSGKERTPSYPGRYALVWRELKHRSSIDSNWVMPFTWNFHAEAGNAFHQFVMPGRPVSHSCVRQFLDDAEWLYYWGKGMRTDSNHRRIRMSGTPVIILDIFDYARKRYGPWLELKSNKDSAIKLPADPMAVEEALIPWCQIPDESKGNVHPRERFLHAEDTLRARGIIRPGVKLTETENINKKRRLKAAKELKAKLLKEKKEHLKKPDDTP
jgi:hypothetical protein